MIKSIKLVTGASSEPLQYVQKNSYEIEFDSHFLSTSEPVSLYIKFYEPIKVFRNHDYTWAKLDRQLISNWYSPKVLKLANKQLVQANCYFGVWEVSSKNDRLLIWHFNLRLAEPLVQFDSNYAKRICHSDSKHNPISPLGLLFPKEKGVEISRSKIPFTAVACFTDHCDFDSLQNLKFQRKFFKEYEIKITKGFFLKNISKRTYTASYEEDHDEIENWLGDGHELAYHSLSQSLETSHNQGDIFRAFEPPNLSVASWIDHGFQPYNLSLYTHHSNLKEDYGIVLKHKGIQTLWNYIDSGTSTKGVINQINPEQFTLNNYYKGIKGLPLRQRLQALVKNIIFHYLNDSRALLLYRSLARYYKSRTNQKSFTKHIKIFLNILSLIRIFSPIFLFWNRKKHQIYPLARFSPVLFTHEISGHSFNIFQTLEMVDFKTGLSPSNIDLLIKESGLFIAHTYFAVPMHHHHGRFFEKENSVDMQVRSNFDYFSKKISERIIWNPTLSELVDHFNMLRTISFSCNERGLIDINDMHNIPFRYVT